MRAKSSVPLLSILLFVLCSGCVAEDYALTVGGAEFNVEVADTDGTRRRGLMERRSLDADAGMLFVFEDNAVRSFWMKDTVIPLSIAYIGEDLVINEIYDMQPLSTVPIPSRLPARYALEVNQGAFEDAGIRVGDRIRLSKALERRLGR
jgi:hypothetical protein